MEMIYYTKATPAAATGYDACSLDGSALFFYKTPSMLFYGV